MNQKFPVSQEEYVNEVLAYLETLDYPAMVLGFHESDVAKSIGFTCVFNWFHGISPRMCAIIIWSATMEFQLMGRPTH